MNNTELHSACKGGNVSLVRKLILEHKADVNARDDDNNTPLHVAAFCGKEEVVLALINEFGCDTKVKGKFGRSLLHDACEGGNVSLVRKLILEHKVDVDARDDDNNTPLNVAAFCGKEEVVLALINEFGCDTKVRGRVGMSLLHNACQGGNIRLVRKLILEHKADVNARDDINNTPLHVAAICGKKEVVLALINEFCCDTKVKGKFGRSLLHSACQGWNVSLVRKLIDKHKADVNARDDNNDTPLHVAAFCGKEEVVLALINEFCCDTKVKGQFGRSLLHQACKGGNFSLVRKLILKHKADVNARDNQSYTPLHVAANLGKEEVVLALINEFCCDTKVKGKFGRSLLHNACQGGNIRLVQKLILEHKADVNVRDDDNNTPLNIAAFCGKEEVVLALINEFGCDTKVKGKFGMSPLHNACERGNVSLVRKLILEHKADVNARDDDNNTPLHVAALFGKKEVVLALINEFGCDIKVKGQFGRSLLHHACGGGNVSLVQKLILEHKADVHDRDLLNNTPLNVAAGFGKKEVVLALINEFGCDTKVKGQFGRSLLHHACQGGNVSLVQMLMSTYEHLSPLVVDEDGNTPLHLCASFGLSNCAESLLSSDAPVLIRNAKAKAPIDLAKGKVKFLLEKYMKETQLVDYEMLREHAKNKYSGSEYITRIFVIGNPGAGKSSLIESLKRGGSLQHFRRVSESIVPPHTAGIVPSIHVSKQYGRVLFYDFAGDAEYYSSHAAILEKLASSQIGKNIFFLVADLREDNSILQNLLHYWFSFIQYQNFEVRYPSLIVIGSHADLLSKNVASEKQSVIDDFVSTISQSKVMYHVSHNMLDCCRPGSKQIINIQRKIKSLIKDSPRYNLSLEESILLGIFDKDFCNVIACPVSTIASHIHFTGIPLATTPKGLYPILEHLQNVGTLFVVGEKRGDYHVVLNTSKLTNTVHEVLFSKHTILDFSKKLKLDTTFLNIGVIPESFLQEILPPYITKECLIQFQYCQEIKEDSIYFFPSIPQCDSPSPSLLFFPALCRLDKSEESWVTRLSDHSYSIGWLAQCVDPCDFFPPRFLHVLLLRVVFKFTLSVPCVNENESILSVSSENMRRCTMWKTGVHWMMEEGVECRVELVESSKSVVVATRSRKVYTENCVTIFSNIINCVMEAKTEFCHTIRPKFFLLDSNKEADYLLKDNHFSISEAESVLRSSGKNVVVSITGKKDMERSKLLCMRKLTYWNSLFPIDYTSVLYYLKNVVKELYELGLHLKISEGKLDAIDKDYPTDTKKRRRELVKEWMSSSLEPPCWWHLVEALNKATHGVLAKEIEEEHSEFIG